jgi:hypothetical protein
MNNIITAILVLGIMGGVFGLILAIASKVFEVEKDPREEEILGHAGRRQLRRLRLCRLLRLRRPHRGRHRTGERLRPRRPRKRRCHCGKIMGVTLGPRKSTWLL